MKILKALYAAELLLSAGAGASRAGPDDRTYLKGGQGRFGPKGSGPNLRRKLPPGGNGGGNNGGGNNGGGNGPGQGNLERVNTCPGGHASWNFCSASPNVDITIIGAGATALGAARFIERYNEMNPPPNGEPFVTYRILEADEGDEPDDPPNLGRCIASYFIHGAEGNPIYELKYLQEQVRGDRPKISEATVKWNDVKEFTCEGQYGFMEYGDCSEPSGPTGAQEFSEIKECVREDDKIESLKLNVALNQCYEEVRGPGLIADPLTSDYWLTDGDKSRIWQTWDYEYAEDPRSTADFSFDPAFECTGQEKDIYLQEGSRPILLREYQYYGIDHCACTGAKVTSITFESSCTHCVKIVTTKGTFYTKQVILTPSVGVLSRSTANGGIDIEGFNTGSPSKHESMMKIFFDPNPGNDPDLTVRGNTPEYNPLYYVIAFQFPTAKAEMWNDDYALINVDFDAPDSPRGMCRWWEVWNNKWGDWHHPDNNMIACVLTTEDIEALEERVGGPGYSIPPPPSSTPALNREITNLFRNSLGIAYGILDDANPNCERVINFDPNAPAPSFLDYPGNEDKCLYRVFPSKENPLWYGSWENVNNIDAYSNRDDRSTPGDDYKAFTDPINHPDGADTASIHMAGAATCFNYWGFLQGSYYSGIGGAYASLENLGKDPGTFPDDEKLDSNYCSGAVPFSIGNPRAGCNGW